MIYSIKYYYSASYHPYSTVLYNLFYSQYCIVQELAQLWRAARASTAHTFHGHGSLAQLPSARAAARRVLPSRGPLLMHACSIHQHAHMRSPLLMHTQLYMQAIPPGAQGLEGAR